MERQLSEIKKVFKTFQEVCSVPTPKVRQTEQRLRREQFARNLRKFVRDPNWSGTTFRLNLNTETIHPFVYRTRSTLSHSFSSFLFPSLPFVLRNDEGAWLLEKGLEVIAFPLTRVYRAAEGGVEDRGGRKG